MQASCGGQSALRWRIRRSSCARPTARNPWLNAQIDAVARAIVVENKWRAQRYGVHGTLVGDMGAISVAEMLDRVIEDIAPDAAALGCLREVMRCRDIARGGTSFYFPIVSCIVVSALLSLVLWLINR